MRRYEPPMMAVIVHEDTLPANSVLEVQVYERHCSIFTPEIVAALIRGALHEGWKPKSKGTFRIGPDKSVMMLPDDEPIEARLARRSRAGLG